jgi:adenylate kinase
MIVAITGTPGTGKSEVARVLAKKLGWKLLELNKLAEEKGLYSGYDDERKCKVINMDALKKEVSRMEGNFVLESHYAHDMPCDVVVALRTNPGELRQRLKTKSWPRKKIEENVEAEIMEVCVHEAMEDGKKVFQFDTTGKKPERVADEIIRILNKFLNPGGRS